MNYAFPYPLLANAVLILHVAVVLFIVAGLFFIIAGNLLRWEWVNSLQFRLAHLLAILTVVLETWIGLTCPLTKLEAWLRSRTGVDAYTESFIEHWLQQLLYYEASPWVFTLAYSLFGLAVILTWWCFPPITRKKSDPSR
jgi:hypothetical protein